MSDPAEELQEFAGFTARNMTGWPFQSGMPFRIFPTRYRLFFIKIGEGRKRARTNLLIDNVITFLLSELDDDRLQIQQQLDYIEGKGPDGLLDLDSDNFVLPRGQIVDSTLYSPGWWKGGRCGAWRFRKANGRRYYFEFYDWQSFGTAFTSLKKVFGEQLKIHGDYRWDATRKRMTNRPIT